MKRALYFWNQNEKENKPTKFHYKQILTQNVLSSQTLRPSTQTIREQEREEAGLSSSRGTTLAPFLILAAHALTFDFI